MDLKAGLNYIKISKNKMEEKNKGAIERVIDGIFDIFYSKDRTKLYVIVLFFLALTIRLIAANNMGLSADDAIHAARPIGVMEAGRLNDYGQSSILWYYIQEVFYKALGTSQMASRTATALFGSLFVILAFLFVKQIFKSKKAGIIAATLAAVSPFFIKMTLPEMDIAAMFFIIFSGLFLLKFTETNKKKYINISAIILGIAVMIKVYALFFVFSYALFLIYNFYKNKTSLKSSFKHLLIFGLIILIFCIPTLTSNYLLYKDKGFMDLMFSNFFGVAKDKARELYGWGAGLAESNPADFKGFLFGGQRQWAGNPSFFYKLPGFIILFGLITKGELLIMIFGWLGLLMLIKNKDKNYLPFFLFALIPAFFYLGSYIPMLKHFTFVPVLFLPMAANFLAKADKKIKERLPKFRLRYILILIIIAGILLAGTGFSATRGQVYTKSSESQLIDFRIKEIPSNSLVIVDSRIYRGYIGWMFNDQNYLESSLFSQAVEASKKYESSSPPQVMPVYFVECVSDDCGWGTIKDQPEFNKSTEDLLSWFANNSKVIGEMKENNKYKFYFPLITLNNPETVYRVYKANINLSPVILPIAKSTHTLMGYALGYDQKISPNLDDYQIHGSLDGLLEKTAHWIIYIALALSLISALIVFYLLIIDGESK